MDMNELFARALKTDPAQIGHYVQGGFMDQASNRSAKISR